MTQFSYVTEVSLKYKCKQKGAKWKAVSVLLLATPLSPSSLPHNINGTQATSSFNAELLLLPLIADKPLEVVFPHAAPVTVPQLLLFLYNPTTYLQEEEKVAHNFISSEGSDKSNSNISREAFVLKVASSCWADVPAKTCTWQQESHDMQKSKCKSSTWRAINASSVQKKPWDGIMFCYLDVVLHNSPPHDSPFGGFLTWTGKALGSASLSLMHRKSSKL